MVVLIKLLEPRHRATL